MKLETLLAGIMLASTVQMAQAADSEHYVALSYDFNDGVAYEGGMDLSTDEKDEGFTLTYGYQFEERFAVEVFYTDAGSFSASGEGFESSLDVSGYGVGFKFDFIRDHMYKVFGKLGYGRYELDQSSTLLGMSDSASENESDYFYGVGGEYVLTPELNIRGEYYQVEVGAGDYNSIKIGLVYGF